MPYKDPQKQKEYYQRGRERQKVNPDKITGYTYKGEPILLTGKPGRPRTGGIARAMTQGIFPEEKYIAVATLYAALGDPQKVSDLTNVPVATIRSWTRQAKFKELLDEIRDENDEKIDAKFCEIVEQALDGLTDRIENGDYHYDTKRGELIRKPVGAKDLALTAAINIDKRQLLRGKPTSRTENTTGAQRLEQLAEQFIKMTQKKEAPALEVEYVEVVEDHVSEVR